MARKIIKRRIPADLLDAVYKAEGWTRREGEVRAVRAKEFYTLGVDARAGLYIATPR